MRVAFCYKQLAPYHHVRLAALQLRSDVTVIEYGNGEGAAFDGYAGEEPYKTIRLGSSPYDATVLKKALDDTYPDVLLMPGWGYAYTLSALAWALDREVPAVAISDSTEIDRPRKSLQEAIKRRVVRLFSSGLVAGKRSKEYLIKLGVPEDRIFEGCDVVDNNHFEEGAQTARNSGPDLREKLGLPQKYFLAVNRFIPEKNLIRLLRAYAAYRGAGAPGDWQLVIVGMGESEKEILRCRSELDLESAVFLLGRRNYKELPAYYGLASAFVLASTAETWGLVVNEAMAAGLPVLVSDRCGCVDDLVEEGANGYTFDPYDVDVLTQQMLKMAGGAYDINAMADASRRIISRWTVEFCAGNTLRAVEKALSIPPPKTNLADKVILKALQKRFSVSN